MVNFRSQRPSLVALALTAVMLPLVSALPPNQPRQPGPDHSHEHNSFEAADLEFITAYTGARTVTLSKLDPLIVVEMDSLILVHGGKRADTKAIPPIYHRLKAVSHIPLAIYVTLAPYGDAPLGDDRLSRLQVLRAHVAAVVDALDRSGFDAEQARRSRMMLGQCTAFLDSVISTRKFDRADLKTLTRSAGSVVLANAADAARAQIDAYHKLVSTWRAAMPAGDWSKLRILVLGRQMGRKHNVAVQYFAKLLGETGESRKLVYAEELSGEQQGLNLLATHQLDSELAEAFFENPDRMEIDLLGNAASVYLDGMDLSRAPGS
jgi:hypothetical protein